MRATILLPLMLCASPCVAQQPGFGTVEAVVSELYASTTRAPGVPFEWDRFRALMLPEARFVLPPNLVGGRTVVMGVEPLIAWIEASWRPIFGTGRDHGIFERQLQLQVVQYGDVAHALTSYEKGAHDTGRVQGRGINSIQLIQRDGRWWIVSVTWAEEDTAGPLPPEFRGAAQNR